MSSKTKLRVKATRALRRGVRNTLHLVTNKWIDPEDVQLN